MNIDFTIKSSTRYSIVSGFSHSPRYDFAIYAKGYANAAMRLSKSFLKLDHFSDYDGYPILFLHRHALELYLKSIIYNGVKLISYQKLDIIDAILNDPKKNKTHSLIDIANKSTKILKEIFKGDEGIESFCNKIEDVSIAFTHIDKDSYSYRYPIDNLGQISTKSHQLVNLDYVYKCMKNMYRDFEMLDFGVNIETDNILKIIEELIENTNEHNYN